MSRRFAVVVAALAVVSVVFLSGCFSYVESPSASLGSTVRITTPIGGGTPTDLAVPLLHEGVLVQSAPTFGLEQKSSASIGQLRETVALDTLWIPETNVQRLEVRRVSVLKTSLAATVVGFLGYALLQKFHPDNSDTSCRSCPGG